MRRFAFAITLVFMLAGSAVAQSTREKVSDPALWGGYTLSLPNMTGVEVSPGTIDDVDSVCWGRTFLTMSENGSFTFMPNYTFNAPSSPSEQDGRVIGGAWTMTYKTDKLNGMLFGEITSGGIEWYYDKAGNLAYGLVTANVNIKGGTESFSDVGGPQTFGRFTGVIVFSKGTPTVEGSLDLLY